jgi:Asp-tRNA(Asn)/Glu-tRNA(Gln) amidotransferase A subunit family amidase
MPSGAPANSTPASNQAMARVHSPGASSPVKDNIDTADQRTTLGSRFHAERIANEDAEVVRSCTGLERFGPTVTTAIGRIRC